MDERILTLLANLEFHEAKDKPGLYHKNLDQNDACGKAGVTAFIDFRRNNTKGRRFYTVEGIDGFCDSEDDVNTIPVLQYFKTERDKILGIKLAEPIIVTPPGTRKDSSIEEHHVTKPHEYPATIQFKDDVIEKAAVISKQLADVIEKAKLYVKISGKKYVRVDGWETLGALLHCRSEITRVDDYKDGYKAFAVIYNQKGEVMSSGSAICTASEKNWKGRDEFAMYSMAQTRALGKAYRLGFSWIMNLAGYEPVAAEEIEKDTEPN